MRSLNVCRPVASFRLLALVLPLVSGCGAQLKFVTVVPKTAGEPSGWQEACLEANVQNMTTGDSCVCSLGIGMPMETQENGYIASWAAEEIAADASTKPRHSSSDLPRLTALPLSCAGVSRMHSIGF